MKLKLISNYSLGKVVVGLINLLNFSILVKSLSLEEYGLFSLIEVISTFISFIFFEWISKSVIRFYYEKNKAQQSSLMITSMLISVIAITTILLLLAIFFAYIFQVSFYLYFFLPIIYSSSIGVRNFISELNRAVFNSFTYFKISLSEAIIKLLFFLILSNFGVGFYYFFAVIALAPLPYSIYYTAKTLVQTNKLEKKLFDTALLSEMFNYGFFMSISSIVGYFTIGGAKIFVERMFGLETLGIFSAIYDFAQRILVVLMKIIHTINYPFIQKLYLDNIPLDSDTKPRLTALFRINILCHIFIFLGVTIFIFSNYSFFSELFLGEQLKNYSLLFLIITSSVFLNRLRTFHIDYSFLLQADGKTVFTNMLIMGLVGLGLIIIFTLIFETILALTIGIFISYLFGLILAWSTSGKLRKLVLDFRDCLKLSGLIAISLIFISFIHLIGPQNFMNSFFISICVFLSILVAIGILYKKTLIMIYRLIFTKN